MKLSAIGIALCVGASFVGCASNLPPPNDQWAAAQNDLGRAQAGGAPQVPEARLHLQLAQEDLQKSHQVTGDDNKRATTLCALARAEAQLALEPREAGGSAGTSDEGPGRPPECGQSERGAECRDAGAVPAPIPPALPSPNPPMSK